MMKAFVTISLLLIGDALSLSPKRLVGYYTAAPNLVNKAVCQSSIKQVTEIDPSIYTHLIYSRATVDPNTFTLRFGNDGKTFSNTSRLTVSRLKANGQTKVLLSLSKPSWSDYGSADDDFESSFYELLSGSNKTSSAFDDKESARRRSVFIHSLNDTINLYSFDGVDIDWAGGPVNSPELPDHLALFITHLKQTLGSKSITFSVPGNNDALRRLGLCTIHANICFPRGLGAAQKHLEFINLKAFDLYSTLDVTTPHSPLTQSRVGSLSGTSVTSMVTAFEVNGFNSGNLNLILGLHGRVQVIKKSVALKNRMNLMDKSTSNGIGYYLPTTKLASNNPCAQHGSAISYRTIVTLSKGVVSSIPGYSFFFDESTSSNYAYNRITQTFISFDGSKSILAKANLMLEKNIAGMGFYGIEMDTLGNEFQNTAISALQASCPNDGSWPQTASGSIASVTCADHSVIYRECMLNGVWNIARNCTSGSQVSNKISPMEKLVRICNGAITNCQLPLNQLTIPSTHNSGSAPLYFINPLPEILQGLLVASGEGLLQCAYNNQDKGLADQVNDGIRGFDFELCYNLNVSGPAMPSDGQVKSAVSSWVLQIISGAISYTVPVVCHGPGALGTSDFVIDAYGYRMDDALRILKASMNPTRDIFRVRYSSSPIAATSREVHHDAITIFAQIFCGNDFANCPAAVKNYGDGKTTVGQALSKGQNMILLWETDNWVLSNGYSSWVVDEGSVLQRTWSESPVTALDVGHHIESICAGSVGLPLDLDLYGKWTGGNLFTCLDTLAGKNGQTGTSLSSFVQQMVSSCTGKPIAAIHLDRYEIFQQTDSKGRTFAQWVNEFNAGKRV